MDGVAVLTDALYMFAILPMINEFCSVTNEVIAPWRIADCRPQLCMT